MIKEISEYLIQGTLLGMIAGISPGPLLTLVISETIKHGRKEGIKLALIPLITDLPIVALSLIILSSLAKYESVVGLISLMGGIFLLYLAYENLFYKAGEKVNNPIRNKNIIKGITANLLSPHPYIFWILIGGNLLFKAYKQNPLFALVFVSSFYLWLVGSKIVVAQLTQKFSSVLTTRGYVVTLRILGVLLLLLALYFFYEGVNFTV